MREDLQLAAYAVLHGFTLHGSSGDHITFDGKGIPHDSLTFKKRHVTVWFTARGWRVARLIDGKYEPPADGLFFNKLYPALEKAYMICVTEKSK